MIEEINDQDISQNIQTEELLNVEELIRLIQQGLDKQKGSQGKNAILLVGPTGGGKSTIANYLTGKKLKKILQYEEKELSCIGIVVKEAEVYDCAGGFKIGHTKSSETSALQIAEIENGFCICDSPGFFDNRGFMVEIANASILQNFLKNCNSVRIVLLISYEELTAQRSAIFKEILKLMSRILVNPEQRSFQKIYFLFTKVPQEQKNQQCIKNEIIDLYESIQDKNDEASRVMMQFLSAILGQLQETQVKVSLEHGQYQDLLEAILDRTPFLNPSEDFRFSISELSQEKIQNYSQNIGHLCEILVKQGEIEQIIVKMKSFKLLKDYTEHLFLRESFSLWESFISKQIMSMIESALSNLADSFQNNVNISQQNIQEIQKVQSFLRIIDEHQNDQVLSSFQQSEEWFKNQIDTQIKNVCKSIYEMLEQDDNVNINDIKINLEKLKQFTDQTLLGKELYHQCLSEIYINENIKLSTLIKTFYTREDQPETIKLEMAVAEFSIRLDKIQWIQEYLSQLAQNSQYNAYEECINLLTSNHQKLNDQINNFVNSLLTSFIQCSLPHNPNQNVSQEMEMELEIVCVPSFELTVLKLLSNDQKYSSHVKDQEEVYRKLIRTIKDLNSKIFNSIKEDPEDDVRLQKLELIIIRIDEIRKLDDSIHRETAYENDLLRNNLRNKIYGKVKDAQNKLRNSTEELDNQQSSREDRQRQLLKKKKDFSKLKSILEYLNNIKWTDKFLQQNNIESSLTDFTKQLKIHFDECHSQIEELISNQKFDELQLFVSQLRIIEGLSYRQEFSKQIEHLTHIENSTIQQISTINTYVQNLKERQYFNSTHWETLNKYVVILKEINKLSELKQITEIQSKSDGTISKISEYILSYFKKNINCIKNTQTSSRDRQENQKQSEFFMIDEDFDDTVNFEYDQLPQKNQKRKKNKKNQMKSQEEQSNWSTESSSNLELINQQEELSFNRLEEQFQQQSDFLEQAWQIFSFQELQILVENKYSLKNLIDEVKNSFNNMKFNYEEESENLSEKQNNYSILELFVNKMKDKNISGLSFLNEYFGQIKPPKYAIEKAFKSLNGSIQMGKFKNLKLNLEQLKNLENETDKSRLISVYKGLKEKLDKEVLNIERVIKDSHKKITHNESKEKIKQHLTNIKYIREVLLDYKKSQFEDYLKQKLNTLLKLLIKELLQPQKQYIINLIKQLQFYKMEDIYQNLTSFYQSLKDFKTIFEKENWEINVESLLEAIQNDIKSTIESLHSQIEGDMQFQQNLLELRVALVHAEKQQSEFQLSYQKAIRLTDLKLKETYHNEKNSILKNISQNQDPKKLQNRIEQQRFLRQSLLNNRVLQIIEIEDDKDLEEMQKDNLKQQNDKINLLIMQKQFDAAQKIFKNSFSKDEIIQRIKNTLKSSLTEILEKYPSMEPSDFQINFRRVIYNFEFLEKSGEEMEQQFERTADHLVESLYAQSKILFQECASIIESREGSFTSQLLEQLFNHESYFQTIEEERQKTQKHKSLRNYLQDILDLILFEIKELQQQQQPLQNRLDLSLQNIQNIRRMGSKFEELLKISKADLDILNKSQTLKEIQEISAKLLNQRELVKKLKQQFCAQEIELRMSLNSEDFQSVKTCIHILKMSQHYKSEFKEEFVNLKMLFEEVQKKIIEMTKEAQSIIKNDIPYDDKLTDLVNKLSEAEKLLPSDLELPSQMRIIYSDISNSFTQKINESIESGNLKRIAAIMIDIQKVSENINQFRRNVEKTLQQVLEKIKKAKNLNIWELGNILKKNASGAAIVNNYESFGSYRTEKWNELVGEHDINYIFDNLELSENGEQKQIISSELRKELNSLYEIYHQKYSDTIEDYKLKPEGDWDRIVDEVKQISQSIKNSYFQWKSASNGKLISMIALICAYWSLTSRGEQKVEQRIILKKPNHSQILSVIMLLGIHEKEGFIQGLTKLFNRQQHSFQNKLIEIRTGEGKSLVLGFSALTLALLGCDVDVICYSNYLSKRDQDDFWLLFKKFEVFSQINYNTIKDLADLYLGQDIRDQAQNFIEGTNQQMMNQNPSSNQKILLIDEVDIFFNSDYYGQTYDPIARFHTAEIHTLIRNIWDNRDQSSNILYQKILGSQEYVKLIKEYAKFKEYIDRQIHQLCISVKEVESHYNKFKYIVKDNTSIGYKQDDSFVSYEVHYGYDTMFAYFYQNSRGKISDQSLPHQTSFLLNCGKISYALLPDSYAAILGVTGTLKTLNASMRQALKRYNISSEIYFPSMFGLSNLDFKEVDMTNVEPDKENQYLRIKKISSVALQNEQAVLIFFKNEQSLNEYRFSPINYLAIPREKYIRIQEYNNSSKINSEVLKSTQSGQISLFSREYGRGTDFVCLDNTVNSAGGVVVIQTFLSDSKTEEIQIKGRTARQGEHGKYHLVLNQQDLESDFKLQPSQITQWKNNQSVDSLYKNLASWREEEENKKFGDIEKKIEEAKQNHNETIKFYNDLKNKKNEDIIKYINKYS